MTVMPGLQETCACSDLCLLQPDTIIVRYIGMPGPLAKLSSFTWPPRLTEQEAQALHERRSNKMKTILSSAAGAARMQTAKISPWKLLLALTLAAGTALGARPAPGKLNPGRPTAARHA